MFPVSCAQNEGRARPFPSYRRLLGGWFCTRQTFFQERDLSRVMRLVLAHMEPLAIIVSRAPGPVFVDGHEPGVIALAELHQRFRTGLLEDVEVVVSVVTLDRFPA